MSDHLVWRNVLWCSVLRKQVIGNFALRVRPQSFVEVHFDASVTRVCLILLYPTSRQFPILLFFTTAIRGEFL